MGTSGLAQLCGQTDDPFQQSCLGWMPAAAVEPRKEAHLLVNGTVCTTEVLRPPPGTGYLRANVGDEVRILYIGATATEDEGWLYARRMSGPLHDDLHCKGLLAEDSVAAVTKET